MVPLLRLPRLRRDLHALIPVDLLVNFTLRDLRSKYKRSALGWTCLLYTSPSPRDRG